MPFYRYGGDGRCRPRQRTHLPASKIMQSNTRTQDIKDCFQFNQTEILALRKINDQDANLFSCFLLCLRMKELLRELIFT